MASLHSNQSRGNVQSPTISLSIALVTATTLLLRASCGYRPFPSIDDFAYLPLSLKALDTALYSRDLIVEGYDFHLPLWPLLLVLFRSTIGMEIGFWLVTLILSLLTVGIVWRLLRGLGSPATLLPVAATLGLVPHLTGLGRGLYDGAFGDAFHPQWMALCMLLLSYDALVRKRPFLSGGLLGMAALAHPVVGLHGAFVVFVAVLVGPRAGWRLLPRVAALCGLVSLPVIIQRLLGLWQGNFVLTWSISDIVEKGYLFRTSHEFGLDAVSPTAAAAMVLAGLLGVAGAVLAMQRIASERFRVGVGLLVGHGILLLATVAVHGPWTPLQWQTQSMLPYVMHLSRTTPVFFLLAAVLATAALELMLQAYRVRAFSQSTLLQRPWSRRLLEVVFLTLFPLFLFLSVQWDAFRLAALLLGVSCFMALDRRLWRLLTATAALVALILATQHIVQTQQLQASTSPEEGALFEWVRQETPLDALFVIPPGFEAFRSYSRRSAYVDFKLFPASTPALIPQWRARMEEVAQPDRLGLKLGGWLAVPQWDRSYAQSNTPERIARILAGTQADYFLWDQTGLEIPPFRQVQRTASPDLQTAYRNSRFTVYRLKLDAGQGRP